MISAIFLLINRFCFESMDIIIERHISNILNFFLHGARRYSWAVFELKKYRKHDAPEEEKGFFPK